MAPRHGTFTTVPDDNIPENEATDEIASTKKHIEKKEVFMSYVVLFGRVHLEKKSEKCEVET